MATANYSTTPMILRSARNVEALVLSRKKRIPIRKTIARSSLTNDKKTVLNRQLYGIRNVLVNPLFQNFFIFTCPSKGLSVPIF
jgi:hypothetical protein